MTDLHPLIALMRRVADQLESTGEPFDEVWARHLRADARGLLLLAAADRHANTVRA